MDLTDSSPITERQLQRYLSMLYNEVVRLRSEGKREAARKIEDDLNAAPASILPDREIANLEKHYDAIVNNRPVKSLLEPKNPPERQRSNSIWKHNEAQNELLNEANRVKTALVEILEPQFEAA